MVDADHIDLHGLGRRIARGLLHSERMLCIVQPLCLEQQLLMLRVARFEVGFACSGEFIIDIYIKIRMRGVLAGIDLNAGTDELHRIILSF